MSTHRCCGVVANNTNQTPSAAQAPHDGVRPPTLLRRCVDIAEWIVPGAILALLPKCPICLAAYIALVTGVGLSMSTLIYLRMLLAALCIASLLYLLVRSWRRAHHLKIAR